MFLSNGELSEPSRYRGDGQIDGLILGSEVLFSNRKVVKTPESHGDDALPCARLRL